MGLGIDVRGGTHRCTAVAVSAIRISFGTTRTTVIANVDGAISCDVTEMLLLLNQSPKDVARVSTAQHSWHIVRTNKLRSLTAVDYSARILCTYS